MTKCPKGSNLMEEGFMFGSKFKPVKFFMAGKAMGRRGSRKLLTLCLWARSRDECW